MKRRDVLKAGIGMIASTPFLQGRESHAAPNHRNHWTAESDVVWTTPSHDASGSMPLGNGEVGINLWVEEGGDLLFYISRSDAFAETARLLKVGQIRISLSPNPFLPGTPFRQTLRLRDGVCEITAGTGSHSMTLQIFVDADHPVVHCIGTSTGPLTVQVRVESWRTEARTLADGDEMISAWQMKGAPFPVVESADIFPRISHTAVAWYHRNESSVAFTSSLKTQSLESVKDAVHDPLLHRTFGGRVTGSGFVATDNRTLSTPKSVRKFAVRVAVPCLQTPAVAEWLRVAQKSGADSQNGTAALKRTTAWWRAYWERSWVVVEGDRGTSVPGRNHPLRIGYDSNRGNPFPGSLGRASVYNRALSDGEIAQLAAATSGDPVPVKAGLLSSGDRTPREIPDATLDFVHGITLEAWINTDGEHVGRIFDKITAGGRDGFLFDVYPRDTLRLIVGARELNAPSGVLKAGIWQHVAMVIDTDSGAARLYLDGRRIAGWTGTEARSPVTQGYTLQRYMQACGGRGAYPIKFNGGIFTVEPKAEGRPFNPDWRAWGEAHWFQNIRHMYHPMIAGGDFEMMLPFFRMYENARPLAEARTQLYHNAKGCYFPETMTVWGTYANTDYGWDRTGKQPKEVDSPWWRYAWNQGLELLGLMLDYWDYTQESTFLKSRTLPMAVSVLNYFDTRFAKDNNGRVRLDPTQAVETFWNNVVNDMPTTAGLNDITTRLCALPESMTTPDQRRLFERMKAAAPTVPIEEVHINGSRKRTLAPAQTYDPKRSNVENPELYAIWPFRLYTVNRPGLDVARLAFERRVNHLDVGWGYDGNCAALLGLIEESARNLQVKCANSNPRHRWPATWGPNFDWLPDQNHGGNLLEMTQLMLLQYVGDRILLLPTWPKHWDVHFKLHAPQRTTVECVFRGGRVERLVVTPESRAKDVVLPMIQ